jgi:hypothetical protein
MGSTVHCEPWSLFCSFLIIWTVGKAPEGRGWRSTSLKAALNTGQHKHRINAEKQSCLEFDLNPRLQYLSGRRQFMPQTAVPL